MVQKSKNTDQHKSLISVNGKNCYLSVKCQRSKLKHYELSDDKSPPVDWLNQFLAVNAPDKITFRHMKVYLDQSRELGKSDRVIKLLRHYGFNVEPSVSATLRQNSFVEINNRHVEYSLHATCFGSNMELKFFPCSLTRSSDVDNICYSKYVNQALTLFLTDKPANLKDVRT